MNDEKIIIKSEPFDNRGRNFFEALIFCGVLVLIALAWLDGTIRAILLIAAIALFVGITKRMVSQIVVTETRLIARATPFQSIDVSLTDIESVGSKFSAFPLNNIHITVKGGKEVCCGWIKNHSEIMEYLWKIVWSKGDSLKNEQLAKISPTEKFRIQCEEKIRLLEKEIENSDANLQKINQGAYNFYELNRERESSAAGWAGAATALGGIGAGIATAYEIESKNAEIRSRNRELLGLTADLLLQQGMSHSESVEKSKNTLERIKKKLESGPTIVPCKDEEALFKKLNAKVKSVEYIPGIGRAVVVEIKATTRKEGSMVTTVDGTIRAKLFCDNKEVESKIIGLPLEGTVEDGELKFLFTTKENVGKYEVKLSHDKLVERETAPSIL